jgi:hypothetical protein
MESTQEESSQDGGVAGEVMESLGEPKDAANEIADSDSSGHTEANDPLYVQKRLKQQKRAHDREMRELHARIEAMQQSQNQPNHESSNSYNPSDMGGHSDEEKIQRGVMLALRHKEMEERKAKEAEHAAHIGKQYQALSNHLDKLSDKYEDFDDVVRGHDAPFTSSMRDAALMLDLDHNNPGNAGEVLYKLGKDPELLKKISNLHPLEQAREMVKLSKALISGGDHKTSQPRTLGNIKSNPVSHSRGVTEKTSPAEIRARMKSGNWK